MARVLREALERLQRQARPLHDQSVRGALWTAPATLWDQVWQWCCRASLDGVIGLLADLLRSPWRNAALVDLVDTAVVLRSWPAMAVEGVRLQADGPGFRLESALRASPLWSTPGLRQVLEVSLA